MLDARVRLRGAFASGGIRSAAARASTIPITAFYAFASTRLILSYEQTPTYAAVALVWSLPALVPFAELGMGTALVNAAAQKSLDETWRVYRAALRGTAIAGALVAGIAVCLGIFGIWSLTFPQSADAVDLDVAIGVLGLLVGINAPLSLVQRFMLGVDKQAESILCMALGGLAAPLVVVTVLLLGAPTSALGAAPGLAILSGNLCATFYCVRRLDAPIFRLISESLHWRPRARTAQLRAVVAIGLPMLAISVVQPLALQSDRILLEWRSTSQELASYSVAFLVFSPISSLLMATSLSLWPKFAAMRSTDAGISFHALLRVLKVQGILSILCTGALALFGPAVATLAAPQLDPRNVIYSFAILLFVQGITATFAMYNTTRSGLLWQVAIVVLMAIGNLILSWFLVARLGASGAVIASAAAIFFLQLGPLVVLTLSERRRTSA